MEQNQTERIRRRRTRATSDGSKTSRRIRVDNRNRLLIARYYYWSEIRRLRFDDVIKILSLREFFVEDRTICNALLDLSAYLDELCKGKTTGKKLKLEYPGWDWSSN